MVQTRICDCSVADDRARLLDDSGAWLIEQARYASMPVVSFVTKCCRLVCLCRFSRYTYVYIYIYIRMHMYIYI